MLLFINKIFISSAYLGAQIHVHSPFLPAYFSCRLCRYVVCISYPNVSLVIQFFTLTKSYFIVDPLKRKIARCKQILCYILQRLGLAKRVSYSLNIWSGWTITPLKSRERWVSFCFLSFLLTFNFCFSALKFSSIALDALQNLDPTIGVVSFLTILLLLNVGVRVCFSPLPSALVN